MTLKGKCQTCRSRKVKCDEKKPKCTACSKGNRQCTYTRDNPAAFVVEDPTQYSKHGKAQVAPIVYPIMTQGGQSTGPSDEVSAIPTAALSDTAKPAFQITTERYTGGGGVFRTLSVVGKGRHNNTLKYTHQQKRRLQLHLQYLKRTANLISYQATAPETRLASRFIGVLNGRSLEEQPLAILGSWIMTIPSRIGNSPHVDLAVEFLADSVQFFRDQNFSNRKIALRSKAKALKALQLEVDQCRTRQTYDTAITMKIHFLAEVLMGITDLFHAIHTVALGQILRQGPLDNPDYDHVWSLIDNTYAEDVYEALIASRPSIYDNDFWTNATKPSAIPCDVPLLQRASMGIMHLVIQLPRLVCLVRQIIEHPENIKTVSMAIGLAETLWLADPIDDVNRLLNDSITNRPVPPSQEIADIISDSIYFDSILVAVQASRFWQCFVSLCGVTETLYLNFPQYYTKSLIPDITHVYERDEHSAANLARSIPYSLGISPELPILPLRIYTTFQISIGTWHRLSRRLKARLETCEPFEAADLEDRMRRADRMVDWVIKEGNNLHDTWKVQRVSREMLIAAVEDMAGGTIHYWLPRSVSFEAEQGEIVMKLQYGIPPQPETAEKDGSQIMDCTAFTPFSLETNNQASPTVPPSLLNNPVRIGPEVRRLQSRMDELQTSDQDLVPTIQNDAPHSSQYNVTYSNMTDFWEDLQRKAMSSSESNTPTGNSV